MRHAFVGRLARHHVVAVVERGLDPTLEAVGSAGDGEAPAIVMTSSREGEDFGPLVEQSGARGFVHKADLSGAAIEALLA